MSKKVMIVIMVFWLAGFSAPQFTKSHAADMAAENDNVQEQAYGTIYVIREAQDHPQMRLYVYLDQTNSANLIGHTTGGQYLDFKATIGEHTVYSVGKNPRYLKIDVKPGETVYIRQNIRIDPRDGTNLDNLEVVPKEVAEPMISRLSRGWIKEQ